MLTGMESLRWLTDRYNQFFSRASAIFAQQENLDNLNLYPSFVRPAYNKGIYAIGATEYRPSAFGTLLNCSNLAVPNKKLRLSQRTEFYCPNCINAGRYGQPFFSTNMRLTTFLSLVLFSCNLSDIDTKKTGLHKVSRSSLESQNNGVFIHSLIPNKTIINIGNNGTDTIKEAWIEYSWQYERQDGNAVVKIDSNKQIVISFKKLPDPKGDVWIMHDNKYHGWTGVASGGNTNENQFYVMYKGGNGPETILDSFELQR